MWVLTQRGKIGEQQPVILASNQHTDHISLQFYIYLLCLSALPCLVSPVFCVCLCFKRTVNCASFLGCVYPICVRKLGEIGCIANVLLATINLFHILKGFWLKQLVQKNYSQYKISMYLFIYKFQAIYIKTSNVVWVGVTRCTTCLTHCRQ